MNIFKKLLKKKEYGIPKAPKIIPMPPVKPPRDSRIIKGDFVRVKEEKAFEVPLRYHYGEVVDVNGKEIQIKGDLRYNHDSFLWVNINDYDLIKKGD